MTDQQPQPEDEPLPEDQLPPEEQSHPRHTKQIFLFVLILAVIGITMPWWRDALRSTFKSAATPSPVTKAQSDTTAAKSSTAATAKEPADATKSKPAEHPTDVDQADAGNAIINYTVEDLTGKSLKLKVNYACNEDHGNKVMMGGVLIGVESEYTPVHVENPTEGTVMLSIKAKNQGLSKFLEIFLYEEGHAGDPFARRRFPFERRFR